MPFEVYWPSMAWPPLATAGFVTYPLTGDQISIRAMWCVWVVIWPLWRRDYMAPGCMAPMEAIWLYGLDRCHLSPIGATRPRPYGPTETKWLLRGRRAWGMWQRRSLGGFWDKFALLWWLRIKIGPYHRRIAQRCPKISYSISRLSQGLAGA